MSTKTKPKSPKRLTRVSKVVEYKAYCRLMWIRRQKGKTIHARKDS